MAVTPLRSMRLADDVWAALETYAADRGLDGRAAAIAHALDAASKPQLQPAHTPANLPRPADQQPAPVLNRKPPNFGPKVDTSMVLYAGNLQAQRVDRLKRSPR